MKIVVLPGDGIGPETMAVAVDVLQAASRRFGLALQFDHDIAGHRHGFGADAVAGAVSYTHLTLPTILLV